MPILIVGHRGASGHVPENTLAAFEKAVALKADAVELDVWPDKNGVPVVIHDASLARTAGVKNDVHSMTAEELARYHVPSLDKVLTLVQGKLTVFIELKGKTENTVAEVIHRKAEQGWNYGQLVVIGFDHDQLKRLKTAHPAIKTGVSFSREMLEKVPRSAQADHMIDAAKSVAASAINPDYRLVNAETVRKAHEAGLKVNVWTVNAPRDIKAMIAFNVDAIISDYPDRVYALLHE
jgi:glycerophosphoryl diester phosphodiesterase